jgi:antitoxin FitA
MGQVLIRNVPDDTIEHFKAKAKLNARSLEQELRDLLERNRPYTPQERTAASRRHLAQYGALQPSLSAADMRDGME